jgi:glutathione S-transferase
MGGVELVLPKEYGYVAIVLVFYCFLNLWMGAQVGKARKQ